MFTATGAVKPGKGNKLLDDEMVELGAVLSIHSDALCGEPHLERGTPLGFRQWLGPRCVVGELEVLEPDPETPKVFKFKKDP